MKIFVVEETGGILHVILEIRLIESLEQVRVELLVDHRIWELPRKIE